MSEINLNSQEKTEDERKSELYLLNYKLSYAYKYDRFEVLIIFILFVVWELGILQAIWERVSYYPSLILCYCCRKNKKHFVI